MKMYQDISLTVRFANAGSEKTIKVQQLVDGAIEFLEIYQDSKFASRTFWELTGLGDGFKCFQTCWHTPGSKATLKVFLEPFLKLYPRVREKGWW